MKSCPATLDDCGLPAELAGKLVRIAGLEPARLAALPPQSSVSANSTISATRPNLQQPMARRQADFGGDLNQIKRLRSVLARRKRRLTAPPEVRSLSPRGTSGERVSPSSAVALLRRADSTAIHPPQ